MEQSKLVQPDDAGEKDRRDRLSDMSHTAFIVLSIVFVLFVAVVIIMLSLVFARINEVLDRVDGSAAVDSVSTILGHIEQGTNNFETSSKEIALAAHESVVRVEGMLNVTDELIHTAQTFVAHPHVDISV